MSGIRRGNEQEISLIPLPQAAHRLSATGRLRHAYLESVWLPIVFVALNCPIVEAKETADHFKCTRLEMVAKAKVRKLVYTHTAISLCHI